MGFLIKPKHLPKKSSFIKYGLAIIGVGVLVVSFRSLIAQVLYNLVYHQPAFMSGWYIHGLVFVAGLVGMALYVYMDYRQHVIPLKREMPTIIYTPGHYAKVVLMPKIRYQKNLIFKRVSLSLGGLLMSVGLMTVLAMNIAYAAPGALTVTINQKTGTNDPNPSYTSVFTVQFSEAIDDSTFVNTDITLGGTAPGQQVQSITEAGTFNKTTYEVRIQATSAGTIQPTIAQELVTAQNGTSGTNQASTGTDNSVTYSGDWVPGEFVIDINITSTQFRIPTNSGTYTYNYNVDCNKDGVIDLSNQTGNTTCTYASPGTYKIAITGTFPHWYTSGGMGDTDKIASVKQWGTIQWLDLSNMFIYIPGTNISALDAPDLSNVTSLFGTFYGATYFNQSINHWDVSSITNMNFTFAYADNYNQPLNSWNTGSVTDMGGMFNHALLFNQPLDSWNVGSVTNMNNMFANGSGLSVENYDTTLTGWSGQALKTGIIFHAGTSKYCTSETQRQSIITNFSWTINDGGKLCPPPNVATKAVTDITENSATLNGSTSPIGVTIRGFEFGITTSYGSTYQDSQPIEYQNNSLVEWSSDVYNSDIAIDSKDNIYTFVSGSNDSGPFLNIRKTDPLGQRLREWNVVSSPGYPVGLNYPALAVDKQDNIYVTNSPVSIAKYSSSGMKLMEFGGVWDGSSINAPGFDKIYDIAVDDLGNIYSRDMNRVVKYDSGGNFVMAWGKFSGSPNFLTVGRGIAVDNNNHVVTIEGNTVQKVEIFDGDGNLLNQWGVSGDGPGQLKISEGRIAISQDGTELGIAQAQSTSGISVFKLDGTFLGRIDRSSDGTVERGIAFDRQNTVYVSGYLNKGTAKNNFKAYNYAISVNLTGLTCGTTYFYRALAINTIGTGYGNNQSFTTLPCVTTQHPFIIQVKTDNPGYTSNNQFIIPTNFNYTYNYNVDCNNDGTPEFTNQTGDVTCTYGSPGEYDIAITGTFPHWHSINNNNDQAKIIDVKQWGDIEWLDMSNMFNNAINITVFTATDTPDLSTVTSMVGTFHNASSFNSNINNWNVVNVTDISTMFDNATSFNQSLDSWDVSNVIDMSDMFFEAAIFNQPLNNWNVSNVDDFREMFSFADSFNQPLNNWDVSGPSNLEEMFANADSFNQPLNNWDISSATSIVAMFRGASSFNQPLNSWDVSGQTDMTFLFFGATSFNQPLNGWDVSNVSVMTGMFMGATSFDQSLASWDVSNVADMMLMFLDDSSPSVPPGFLDSIESYIGFRPSNNGLSTPNYDATLISWSAQNLESSVVFDAGTSKYCTI
jgi:hypothetical protein